MLHSMESDGLLVIVDRNVEGKIRKYYSTEDRKKVYELFKEIIN
ncbi:hypothetical protein JNUCC6_05615 [Viridibacillus arvi]|nr:hypothetical protein JNUCC6_05615 [Viridibacillus sp. JNUCC-6]